ncbi:MAG: tRNA uridine-5-carboxymethylaminomethyl(34) synthesis GTPase MnmE [Cellvibrionales bacterium]|nr:tRNA uridine-5-carboxymethylaminomethyl(34) synthesis GTPase MnmE [Cellvibrionales bacterium]
MLNATTIAAIATAPGKGGVGIIRISGPCALSIANTICQKRLIDRKAIFSNFYQPNSTTLLDEGIALFFQSPNSFTGEDVVELQGHGGPVILDMLLDACIQAGAIQAKAGEFSERAFLNNKIDLTQAEAIADLIDSASKESAKNALQSLQGAFSKEINHLLGKVIDLRTFVEAAIDFPDEEIDFISESNVSDKLKRIIEQLDKIFQEANQGRILQEGMNVVIAGKPNAGKSSLLNALAGEETAIVTPIAGTTRDIIREKIVIDGLPIHITDTAGIRESADIVEQEGIKRAKKAIETADAVLLVIDSQNSQDAQDNMLKDMDEKTKLTRIFNKIDLLGHSPQIQEKTDSTDIYVSAQTGEGIDLLKTHLTKRLGLQQSESKFSARRRHISALENAKNAALTGLNQLEHHGAAELLAEDLRLCQQYLSEITGQFTSDDLLGEIFSSFCIGK